MSIGTGGTRESLRRGRVDDVDLAKVDRRIRSRNTGN